MDLVEQEKRVAEYYAMIGEVVRRTWGMKDLDSLLSTFSEQIGLKFGWQTIAIILKRGNRLYLRTYYQHKKIHQADESVSISSEKNDLSDVIIEAVQRQKAVQSSEKIDSFPVLNTAGEPCFFAAIPLNNRNAPIGVLVLGRTETAFDHCEMDIFYDLAEHVSLAIDNVYLYEENEQLLLAEERSRLARDLHDSVNQKLFSLSLITQGLRIKVEQEEKDFGDELRQIGELAQEALTEMKSLVWELYHHDDNKGLGLLLEQHAGKLGLNLVIKKGRHLRFASNMQKELWRVGQEALNNVKKHASVDRAEVEITCDDQLLQMRITDHGLGFQHKEQAMNTLGLISMSERVRRLNGRLEISSAEAKGTTITVVVPLESEGKK